MPSQSASRFATSVPTSADQPSRGQQRRATILFAHDGHNWITGAERCLLDLVTRIDASRFRPVVICNSPTLQREVERLGFHAELVPKWAGRLRRHDEARTRVRRILQEQDVSLVHANMIGPIGALLPEVRRAGVPLVLHMHVPAQDLLFDRLHSLMHQATVTVGVAEHVLRPLRQDGMAPKRLRVIYNAVDAERLEQHDATGLRAELGIADGAFVAMSLGSLIHRKGHDVTLRAVALARRQGLDAHLVICGVGDGGTQDSTRLLNRMAEQYGITDAVHLLGTRHDVGALLRDVADLYVSSARGEALPLNVLEAQWIGVPVVASDIEAHREALAPDTTGILFPVEDSNALGEEIVRLASDRACRDAMRAAGRQFSRERFAMSRYVVEFEQLYDELLSRPRFANGWLLGSSWPEAYTGWVRRIVLRRLGLYVPPPTPYYPPIPADFVPELGSDLEHLYLGDNLGLTDSARPEQNQLSADERAA